MKYLPTFKTPLPCAWLELAINSRKENVNDLINLKDNLTTVYDSYDNIISQYQLKPSSSIYSLHEDLLKSYYNSAPTKLNANLITRRNNHELIYCPYCGDPKIPDTLDHFMPKDDWPEFSFFPNNLVPQCRGCAPIKGTQYFCDITSTAKFLHPIYFDILNKLRFIIRVSFDISNSNIEFHISYKISNMTAPNDLSRLKSHIKNLKLNMRIKFFCMQKYSYWKNKISLKEFNIKQALNQRITEKDQSDLQRDWETTLYIGMLDNEMLLDYLNSLTPRTNNIKSIQTDSHIEEFEIITTD